MSISSISGEIHMVLDNVKYHHANLLKEFLESNSQIILEFLPPYSPELNSIERVWKIVKSKATLNRYFQSMGDLILALTEQFAVYANPNSTLRKLCAIT
ncbi:MAG: transposase [Thermoplasmataceae archaeon]|jgi:transposase